MMVIVELCIYHANLKYYGYMDKYTQVDSRQISLVQVDLEQIKYIIQHTFLDQMEM